MEGFDPQMAHCNVEQFLYPPGLVLKRTEGGAFELTYLEMHKLFVCRLSDWLVPDPITTLIMFSSKLVVLRSFVLKRKINENGRYGPKAHANSYVNATSV